MDISFIYGDILNRFVERSYRTLIVVIIKVLLIKNIFLTKKGNYIEIAGNFELKVI